MRTDAATLFFLLSFTSTAAAAGGGSGGTVETPPPLATQTSAFTTPGGVYFDLYATWAQLGGDFDGDTVLTGATDTIEIPDADDGAGVGLAIGYRWDQVALELAFTALEFDGTLSVATGGEVYYGALELNGRYFFRVQERFQPFLQAGLGVAVANLEDSSTGASGTGDGDLYGGVLNAGAGAEYYLTEHFSLGFRALYRYTSFTEAEGVDGDEGEIDDEVEAGGVALELGITFTL
jgi:opacity protein-like surface antigen